MRKIPANTMKANKSDAFRLARKLFDGGDLTDVQKASLMLYFAPSRTGKPKTSEQWAAKAVERGGVRKYLEYLYSDGTRLIGCDGHRLHVVAATDKPAGYYEPSTGDVATVNHKYPEVDRIIPKGTPPTSDPRTWPLTFSEDGRVWCYTYHDEGGQPRVALNKKYVDDAMSYHTGGATFWHDGDAYRPVLIQFDNGDLATIMPMRV